MSLSLKVFGQVEVRDSSGAVRTLPTRKTWGLLGYLVINAGRPQPRERLMSLLWSDRGDKQARQSLNHALRAIRKLAEPEGFNLIESDGDRVTLRGEVLESDVGRFRKLLDEHPGEAASLYAGPLLDGLSVQDPAFEEWLTATRSEFHSLACDALNAAAASSDGKRAIIFLQRLLSLDPLREEAHRELMRRLCKSGDRAGALRQYQACADVLRRDLQVGPDTTTQALYEKIKIDPETPGSKQLERSNREMPKPTSSGAGRANRRRWVWATDWRTAVAAVVLLVAGSGATIWVAFQTSLTDTNGQAAQTLAQISGKPSIAVLPFNNLSDDKDQEYFSDGMTEDLLTDLSKISALTVISRSSTFAYKGRTPDIRAVAEELEISHVIEGSVRKAGGRVRISVRLIDAATGENLWAERYDRKLKDIFSLQDEVRSKIVSALAIKLVAAEAERVELKGTKSVEAYDLFLKGRHQESSFTREGIAQAAGYFEKAIAIDPGYSNAYARLANMYDFNVRFGWTDDAEDKRRRALELAEKAVALDANNPYAHWTRGRIISRLGSGRIEDQFKAIGFIENAIELDPNYADAYAFISLLYVGVGEPNKATAAMRTAMKLNPQYPFWYIQNRAIIRYMQGDYDAAIADLEKAAERNPTAVFVRWWLAAAYAQSNQQDEAEWQIEEMKGLGFESTVKALVESMAVIHHPAYQKRFASGLRKAGIPE